MKLTQEELSEIGMIRFDIDSGQTVWNVKSLLFLLGCIDKLHTKSRDRFTYEWREYSNQWCLNGKIPTENFHDYTLCHDCKGLGKVKIEVKAGKA